MFDNMLSIQHGLIMESTDNVTNYDVMCARLMRENAITGSTTLIPVLDNTSEKYIKKIDDAFSVLADISVDADQMAEFFAKIQQTPELDEIPLSTPIKNVNDFGRIKPEYLTQIVKDSASTINEIVNNKTDMKELMNHFSPDLSTRIKKQLVITGRPIPDIKTYVKLQENPEIVPMDSQAIMTMCIPFLRSFPVKKRELQEEITAVKVAINTSASLIRSYTDTAEALKKDGKISGIAINNLNYYLYNQNRLLEELITYMVFCLISKIDAYTFNINSYMELYKKVLRYNPEGENVYHESVFEYSLAAMDVDSSVNTIIHGDATSIVDWARRTYDAARSAYDNHRIYGTSTNIDFTLDQYEDTTYPYGNLYDVLDKIADGIEKVRSAVRDPYASPESIMKSAGFEDSLTSRFSMLISEIADISKYFKALNDGKSKSSVLFSILAEMRASVKAMEEIGEEVKEVYKEINDTLDFLEHNPEGAIPNELVRKESIYHVTNVERDFRNFLGVLIQNIIQRGKSLEEEVFTLVNDLGENIDAVPTKAETNYNILAVEGCMEIDEVFNRLFIESEMIRFKNEKIAKEYGFVTEAEETVQQKPVQQTSATQPEKKETATPEVTVDPKKQNPNDVKQNNIAAEQAKEEGKANDPEKKQKLSDRIKELISKINGWFGKIVPDFIKSITSQLQNNQDFLTQYKEAVLNRSFNGVTLNIYDYFNLSSQSVLDDISKVSAAISQISDKDLVEYAKPEVLQQKLFGFLKLEKSLTFDDAVRIYYKVGPGKKEIAKISLSNTELKNRTQEMVAFCEDYYGGGYKNVEKEVNELKNALNNKINSEKNNELSEDEAKALQAISREVMVFTAAVLTGFRNRSQHYMFAIRKLVPRTAKPTQPEGENQNAEGNEGQNEPAPATA